MGRILGLDLGAAWVGVAVGDESLRIATPRPEIKVTSPEHAIEEIRTLVASEKASAIIIGLPITMRGELGPQAIVVEHFTRKLREALQIPVHLVDERLTSKQAQATERPDARDGKSRKPAKAKPAREDSQAAALILQSWFDRPDRPD